MNRYQMFETPFEFEHDLIFQDQKWTTNDLGSSSKPNQMDYKRVKLLYDCPIDEEGDEAESKWHGKLGGYTGCPFLDFPNKSGQS